LSHHQAAGKLVPGRLLEEVQAAQKGILKQMLGTEFMDYWVGTQPAYKKLTGSNAEIVAKRGKIKDAAFSNLTIYLFI
jgi:hypothetical protein